MDPATWVPARSRAGIQAFSRESPDAKSRGGGPPPPLVYGPLVPTRSFWRLWRIVPVEGLFRCPCTCPDLGRFFVWGCTTQRLPLGGKLSPKVTDEGATGLPNGAEEKFRWGDRWQPSLFYKERLGTGSPPHPTRLCRPTFPPRGRLWGWVLSFRVSTVPPIYPAGHASQSFPARRRGKKIQSCFDRLRRPKHTSHPESAGSAGAVRGASSNFGSPAQRVPKFPPPYSPSSTTVRPQGRPWPSHSRRQQVVVISSLR